MKLLKKIAVNLLHVRIQDLEPTRVLVNKDILEMEKHVKVSLLRQKFLLSAHTHILHQVDQTSSSLFAT